MKENKYKLDEDEYPFTKIILMIQDITSKIEKKA